MTAESLSLPMERDDCYVNRQELRQLSVALFSVATATGAVGWYLIALRRPRLDAVSMIMLLALVCALAFRLRHNRPRLAAVVQVGTLFCSLLFLATRPGLSEAAYFLLLPCLAGAAYFGAVTTLALTLLGMAAVFFVSATIGQTVVPLMLLAAAGASATLVAYPVESALNWAWQCAGQVNALADELRDRQGRKGSSPRTGRT